MKNVDLQLVTNCYDPKMMLIDGSVPHYLAERWVSQAEAIGLPCHDLGSVSLEVDLK